MSSQIRMAYLRSPNTRTSATPGAVCIIGLAKRLAKSLSCKVLSVSELNEIQMTGKASASTLEMTGSSMPVGRRCRTRETLSRTSAAAASGSRVSKNLTVIWLCSWRLMEEMTSKPSTPESESSNTLVTCDSMTALDAPT